MYEHNARICLFFVFIWFFSVGSFNSVVSTSANDWLEKHVSKITYNVSMSVVKPYMLTYSACAWRFVTCDILQMQQIEEQTDEVDDDVADLNMMCSEIREVDPVSYWIFLRPTCQQHVTDLEQQISHPFA